MFDFILDFVASIYTVILCRLHRFFRGLFPSMGCRFVSVLDCLDSEGDNTDMLHFRSLMNDYHLKDLSSKIKSVILDQNYITPNREVCVFPGIAVIGCKLLHRFFRQLAESDFAGLFAADLPITVLVFDFGLFHGYSLSMGATYRFGTDPLGTGHHRCSYQNQYKAESNFPRKQRHNTTSNHTAAKCAYQGC